MKRIIAMLLALVALACCAGCGASGGGATTTMTEEDFFHMIDAACSPVRKLEKEFGVEISLMPETCKKLVTEAAKDGEGVRGMENKLCVMLEDALYEEEDRRHFVL